MEPVREVGKGEANGEVPLVVTNEAIPVGGRLRRLRNRWKFDRWATSIVSSGLGWEWLVDQLPKFRCFKQKSTPILREFVKELLDKNAIHEVNVIWFQGSLFTVPKKGTNKLRMILDLSKVKQIHPLRQVSDVNSRTSTHSPTSKRVYNLNRPNRCLLARANSETIYPLPWIPSWQQEVCLPIDAFWPQYRPQSFHKTSCDSRKGITQSGDSSSSVSGRLDRLGVQSRGVLEDGKRNNSLPPIPRFSDKRKEVKASTSSGIHMVGVGLGLDFSLLINSP